MKKPRKQLPPGVVRGLRAFVGSDAAAARDFGVAVSTAANIRARWTRTDVPDEPPAAAPRRRLSDDDVRAIRASRAYMADDAARYGVSTTTIFLIRARKQIYLDVA